MQLYDESNTLICELDRDGIEAFCKDGSTIKLNNEKGLTGYTSNKNKYYQALGEQF
jgi:hypothetical protein